MYSYKRHTMQFIKPAKTSKIDYQEKDILILEAKINHNIVQGECAPLPHLSMESIEDCEQWLLNNLDKDLFILANEAPSSLKFALEGMLLEAQHKKKVEPIKINGLVWMNGFEAMEKELDKKVEEGFECIKIKVGQHDFDAECRFLEHIRKKYHAKISLRLDANGAFEVDDALQKLKDLSRFQIHSIEQPIASGQWDAMEMLCKESKIDIALDEELIGLVPQEKMLQKIKPKYLIFKPSLHGGFSNCDQWIALCRKNDIDWWATSALESNIGLYQIALWLSEYNNLNYQGLGTGSLFKQNFKRPLERNGQWLRIR